MASPMQIDKPTDQDKQTPQQAQNNNQQTNQTPQAMQDSAPRDPRVAQALSAYEKLKEEVVEKETKYNEIANNSAITTDSKKAKLAELKDMQDYLEESRQVWRKQHPQRLEFLSAQEMEEEKQRRKDAVKWQKVVVPKDLPVLQLAGGYKWDPKKVVHNSAAAFIRAFERELHAHDLSVDEHWQRLLSRSLNDPQYLWLKGQLAAQDGEVTWQRVADMITEKYDTQVQKYRAMRRVVRLQQGPNESIDAYILKFQQLSLEAEMPTGLLLIIIFMSSLL